MPLPPNYPDLVYARAFAAITAGVTAYNVAVDAGQLPSCRKVDTTWLLDDRPKSTVGPGGSLATANGREQARVGGGEPTSYPRVELHLTGGTRPGPAARTFGVAQGRAGCPVVMPETVTLTETITYGPEQTADCGTTPLESFIDDQYRTHPTLGLTACLVTGRPFVRGETSTVGDAPMRLTYRRTTMTVSLRPQVVIGAWPPTP